MRLQSAAQPGLDVATQVEHRLRGYNHALIELSNRAFQQSLTLNERLRDIVQTGATTLTVPRANLWRVEGDRLRCIESWVAPGHGHRGPVPGEELQLDCEAYAAALPGARVIRAGDVLNDAVTQCERPDAEDPGDFQRYLDHHKIVSLLDAPVRVNGELVAVLCHETTDEQRDWQPDEASFAGNLADLVALAFEVDRRHRAEAERDYQLLHDPVTGLPNRRLFVAEALRVLTDAAGSDTAAMLYVDIDRFARVNQRWGEAAGDRVLAVLATRLREAGGRDTKIARIESDSFAVLMPGVKQAWEATSLGEVMLARVGEAIQVDDATVLLSASIGIAFERGGNDAAAVDRLIERARGASDVAKSKGRERVEVFDAKHQHALDARLETELGLRRALSQHGFEMVYQPEFDLTTGRITAAEALLRWRQDDGTLESPSGFIDVAEASGLILPVGERALRQALDDAATWPVGPDGTGSSLRVNLSPRQFEDAELPAMVADALAAANFDPRRLCLEITETTLMRDGDASIGAIQALRALGCRVAIDDFGTGYSSLAYLRRLPVDVLKLDRSMVESVAEDEVARAIVAAVIELSRVLRLEVVAEGIETVDQERVLRELGCTRVQGFHYARPMAADDLRALLVRQHAND